MNGSDVSADGNSTRRYWAFISYSHSDNKWGAWLHEQMERYRVPRSLVGKAARDGAVPVRLEPVFRDREELPVSSELGANLKGALERSRYLVVICSPRAARSRWVDEEVRQFKALHGEDRLLCLIVAGEPNAVDKPGHEESECFPAAVRFRLGADGAPGATRTEPIEADVRPRGDGPRRAKLKIIAVVLGVDFRRAMAARAAAACPAALAGRGGGAGAGARSGRGVALVTAPAGHRALDGWGRSADARGAPARGRGLLRAGVARRRTRRGARGEIARGGAGGRSATAMA